MLLGMATTFVLLFCFAWLMAVLLFRFGLLPLPLEFCYLPRSLRIDVLDAG
jgi:hypothetical protein